MMTTRRGQKSAAAGWSAAMIARPMMVRPAGDILARRAASDIGVKTISPKLGWPGGKMLGHCMACASARTHNDECRYPLSPADTFSPMLAEAHFEALFPAKIEEVSYGMASGERVWRKAKILSPSTSGLYTPG